MWRVPEGPGIPVRQRSNTRNHTGPGCGAGGRWRGLAAVPVGGGRAWPGFETTRRAKLAARTASGRAAAHRHARQPGSTVRRDSAWNASGAASNTAGAAARRHARQPGPTVRRDSARNASGAASNTAGAAAHRHARQPGPTVRRDGARNASGAASITAACRRPPARQAARPPQQGATVPGAPVEPHTTAGNQPEYAASSVARWTPPRPASWAAWVRHEKPSARYTASGCASSVGSSECDATATDKS